MFLRHASDDPLERLEQQSENALPLAQVPTLSSRKAEAKREISCGPKRRTP
jgi:hypothetical protein